MDACFYPLKYIWNSKYGKQISKILSLGLFFFRLFHKDIPIVNHLTFIITWILKFSDLVPIVTQSSQYVCNKSFKKICLFILVMISKFATYLVCKLSYFHRWVELYSKSSLFNIYKLKWRYWHTHLYKYLLERSRFIYYIYEKKFVHHLLRVDKEYETIFFSFPKWLKGWNSILGQQCNEKISRNTVF